MRSSAARQKTELSTVRQMVHRLGDADKLKLFAELREETWAQRFDETVNRIRDHFKAHPLSDEEIRRECEAVREELFLQRRATRRR